MDINSVTGPIVTMCELCDEQPAVVRITAVDANSVLLDSLALCMDCVPSAGEHLACGTPTEPIIG